ncbi:hypothetical protein FNH09_28485 [Streptomyces adustus]|uniref:Uncharacterized protein n=1 Tax=Streptomyces adustus TaxID=1609272 RepID=A0A5N8VJ02_9ACTN|nr:hypothetical protein [Streptomyces adustus]MPY35039.1 hypothetical protein [Streptomyces adustus]
MDVNLLTMDLADLTSAGGGGDSVLNDCLGTGEDVKAVQSHAPIPDPDWQAAWESALTAIHNGYQDCAEGFSGKGKAEIESAAATLTAVTKEFGP